MKIGEDIIMTKAIFKFNSGHGALCCSGCNIIIKEAYRFSDEEMAAMKGEGELEAQYCEECMNKNKLTDKEWVELTKEWCKRYKGGKHQRAGQAYMNALFKVNKRLHDKISGTENDCFYDENKIINFIRFLNK